MLYAYRAWLAAAVKSHLDNPPLPARKGSVMDVGTLGDSLGLLVAAALGGLLGIAGSVLTQSAGVRQAKLEKRAVVYQEILEIVHRLLQSAESSSGVLSLGASIKLFGNQVIQERDRRIKDLVTTALKNPEKMDEAVAELGSWIKSIGAAVQKAERHLEQELDFIEDPETIRPEIQRAYLLQARWTLHVSPLINSQMLIVDYIGRPTNLEIPTLRREVDRLERFMRLEIAWSSRSIPWRATLRCYSMWTTCRERKRFRGIRESAGHRPDA